MEASRGSLSPVPIHLHPAAPLAERVLLPGDPGRALRLAQSLLKQPIMFNHHRGLWGYTGQAPDGRPLTIQSTGMGGPSAAIVIAELADLGAETLIRVGTCGALVAGLALGDLIVATEALRFDGTSSALLQTGALCPDAELIRALQAAAGERTSSGPVASTDLFYDGPPEDGQRWLGAGAVAVEMETATLFALAQRRSLRAASLLLVTDLLLPHRIRIPEDALQAGELRLGEVALGALVSGR
ncbi:MAG: purine-nucleoside phosphorylase [Solirubrobacteraceae bacterium]